jgi:ubiquinone/menaquinone biosynthesis C-methylase UbiE
MDPRAEVEAFKRFEFDGWQQSVDAYDNLFGPLTDQVVGPLLAALQPKPGERLLDVATGPGYLAARAAALGCDVVAIDISEAMIKRASRLQRTTRIDFRVGDAESLDLPAGAMDIVAMNFGVLHLAEPARAAAEAYRVLKAGGRFGFTVWSSPQESAAFAVVLRAIETHGSASVKLPAGPPFFKFSERAEGIALLTTAGFVNVTAQLLPLTWRLPEANALFEAFYHGTARTGGNLRAQPAENRDKIRRAVTESAASFVRDGGVELPMAAWVYAGVKRATP